MVKTASIRDFKDQRNKLPGDRKKIDTVGPYVLELYFDPLGQRPKSTIEINKLGDDGEYSKVTSVHFEPDEHDDPEGEARNVFSEMQASVSAVESYL